MAICTPRGLPVAADTAACTTGELAATSATEGLGAVDLVGWAVAGTWAAASDGVGEGDDDGEASSAWSPAGRNSSMKGPGETSFPAGPFAGGITGAKGLWGAGGSTGAGSGAGSTGASEPGAGAGAGAGGSSTGFDGSGAGAGAGSVPGSLGAGSLGAGAVGAVSTGGIVITIGLEEGVASSATAAPLPRAKSAAAPSADVAILITTGRARARDDFNTPPRHF